MFEKTNLILPAAHGQLEKTNPGGSDMDSGHVDGSISKNKYKSCIVPEGLGLWRVGLIIPFRPERPNGQGGLRVKTDHPRLM